MKLLILDTSHFGYVLDHKTPVGEEVKDNEKKGDFKNCLSVFITIEKSDQEEMLNKVSKDIVEIALKNNRKTIFINPFAHLSSNLANPKQAISLVKILETTLMKNKSLKIIRGAFGWYKQFDVKIEGHNNSQIFREYN